MSNDKHENVCNVIVFATDRHLDEINVKYLEEVLHRTVANKSEAIKVFFGPCSMPSKSL